jgi:hypothetical protein
MGVAGLVPAKDTFAKRKVGDSYPVIILNAETG